MRLLDGGTLPNDIHDMTDLEVASQVASIAADTAASIAAVIAAVHFLWPSIFSRRIKNLAEGPHLGSLDHRRERMPISLSLF